MSEVGHTASRFVSIALMCALGAVFASSQQNLSADRVPPNFRADMVFASRLRSQLLPYTETAGQYTVAKQVMDRLVKQLPAGGTHFSWELRIARDAGNIFSSPDGTIYVDKAVARLLGSHSGLWAAALSHEIAHVTRRDWARRYLFEKSLQGGAGAQIALGDGGGFSGAWVDARTASIQLANFCQTMEMDADAEGLVLMARAGFHPSFAAALHHLLQAQPGQFDEKLVDASHPSWEERDSRLQKMFLQAGEQYDQFWPDRYASPGGNPPVVVYTEGAAVKRNSAEVTITVPLRCQNLSGSVEVVLRIVGISSAYELRQFTGCTSDRTLITFNVPERMTKSGRSPAQAEVSVLDDSGWLLNRKLTSLAAH